jgi:hypothetical protein
MKPASKRFGTVEAAGKGLISDLAFDRFLVGRFNF